MLGSTLAPPREPPPLPYREPSSVPRREPATPRRQPAAPPRRPAAPRIRVEPAPGHRSRRSRRQPLHGLARAVLPRQSWIDRIVRGRAWIPVFGALLVAIVGMRVEVLKLSSRVGTQISQASELQSSNALLRSAVSGLSGTERIEALAERLGMVMPGPMDIHFVPASDGDHVQAAIRAIHAPEPDSFLTGLADERQADQTSLQAAAETSAVGVLANTVPGYGQSAGDGIASDPVVGPLSTTGSLSSTTGAGSAAPASTAATGADAAASGTAASATSTATGTQSGSSAGTVTPSQSAAQAPSTTSSSSPTSGLGGGASDPPTSSGTATLAGSQSGSTSGGTSLSG